MKRIITLGLAAALFAFPGATMACQRPARPMLLVGSNGDNAMRPVTNAFVGARPADPFGGPPSATHAIPLTVAIRFSTDFPGHRQSVALDPPCTQSSPNIISILLHGIKTIRDVRIPH